jgi:peptidoglycan hydrolase-like amidase
MSRAGKKADEILSFYYPGTTIMKDYGACVAKEKA